MFIYCITNIVNKKKYIGQTTVTVEKRFQRHCWESTLQRACMPISLAIRKYGKENFIVKTLCECTSQNDLDSMEIFYTVALNTMSPNGYNLKAGSGKGSVSEETKKKISQANFGKKRTEESKLRMSLSHKGKKLSKEHRRAVAKGLSIANKKRAKTYTFISPDNETIQFTNMKQFCQINNLSVANMFRIIRGDRSSYKGWRFVSS